MSAVNVTVTGLSKRINLDTDSTHAVRTTTGKVIAVEHDLYAGPYTVVPDQSMQVLETDKKNMAANVIVEPIPYYETSNEKGTTVYIGV